MGMRRSTSSLALAAVMALTAPRQALSWGDEGHRIVSRIALPLLTAPARAKVEALLAADTDTLTAPDFVSRTTWADRWRDSDRNSTKIRYTATQQWHFVDIELARPDLAEACFGFPLLAPGTVASAGPAKDCVVAKIKTFAAELADAAVPEAERVIALKFLLHFTGDLHQPLHAADNIDQGGNTVQVLFGNHRVASRLHAYWDTAVVARIGRDEAQVANALSADFAARRAAWIQGTPEDWAQETFGAARDVAYALPHQPVPDEHGVPAYQLDADYEDHAESTAREQLAKSVFRLALLWQIDLKAVDRAQRHNAGIVAVMAG